MLKAALILILATSPAVAYEQYCGVDVPYDILIDGSDLQVRRANSKEECSFANGVAQCPDSLTLTVKDRPDGSIELSGPGWSEPAVMPNCTVKE